MITFSDIQNKIFRLLELRSLICYKRKHDFRNIHLQCSAIITSNIFHSTAFYKRDDQSIGHVDFMNVKAMLSIDSWKLLFRRLSVWMYGLWLRTRIRTEANIIHFTISHVVVQGNKKKFCSLITVKNIVKETVAFI